MASSNVELHQSPHAQHTCEGNSHRPEYPVVPLSIEQEQIWLHGMLAAGLPLYNETVTIRYRGQLSIAALEAALYELRQRHEILRTTIEEQNGAPYQRVGPALPLKIESADVSELSEEAQCGQAAQLVSAFATRAFDLARGPLLRILVIAFASDDMRIYLAVHHLIFDGVSLRRIILPELIELYEGFHSRLSPLSRPPRLQYADYVTGQRSALAHPRDAELAFWRVKLADFSPLTLPVDRPRTPQTSFCGTMFPFAFDRQTSDALRQFALRERTTIFNVFLASFVVLLARYSDTTDVTLGITYGGRAGTDLEDVIGCFLNTLLLRTDLSGDPSFQDALQRVREVTLEALDYANTPFQEVVRESSKKASSSEPPVQVMFSFQPPPPELPDGWDLDVFETSNGTSKFDLHLEIEEKRGTYRGRLQFNTDLFDPATIASLQQHWATLLQAAVQDPQSSIWKLPLLTDGEHEWLLRTLNQTVRNIPPFCAHELFVQKAAEFPDRIAVSFHQRRLTYRQLEESSAALARHLVGIGFGPGAVIGLMVERSPELLISLLGILRAGATYVPMDPNYPPARLEHMLNASGAGLLLTQKSLHSRLPGASLPRLDVVDFFTKSADARPSETALPDVPLSSSAYIIFTSGSTGVPKGVEIPHGGLTNLLCSMQERPGIDSADILLAITSVCFDIAGLEFFLPLIAGARIEIASAAEAADPQLLRAKIEQSNATVLQATPVSWRMLIETGWEGSETIKLLCGGEAMTENLARQLQQRSGSVWNMYGPTETTIWSSCARVQSDLGAVTLGDPVANTSLFVLDIHRNLVPAGVSGELYIGGDGLAIGYRGQPGLTGERFPLVGFADGEMRRLYRTGDRVKRLRDGSLQFLGRMDRQIKLNGFRIELGEIEQVLNSLPGVQDSVVIKSQLAGGEDFLAGFIIPKIDCSPNVEDLRSGLAKFLPKYMQPARLLVLTDVPLTPNGKLDRNRLPELLTNEVIEETELPQPGTEQALSRIWCELLQLKSVGRRDNFFDIGGHSLLATRFIAHANRAFGRTFTLASFVQAPTIAQFALIVEGQSAPVVRLAKRGSTRKQLLWIGADPFLVRLANHLRSDLGLYTLSLDSSEFTGADAVDTIAAMAARLLARIREVQPHGPYLLGGYCIHGLLAFEVAQQLQQINEEVGLLILADLYAPGHSPQRTRLKGLINRMRTEVFHLGWFMRWPVAEWGPYLRHRWQKTLNRAHSIGGFPAPPRDLQEALDTAESQYRCAPYSGKVMFLESDEGRLFQPTTSASWRELINDIEIFTYPGEHEAVLKEPHLGLAAEAIQKSIDRAVLPLSLAS